jgi:hypothetical protein
VGNLHANALNAGLDPFEVLASYPLERVAMLHVAGGVMEHGFYFDTHAHAVPAAVFALVERVTAMLGALPILLERDANYDAHAQILDEVGHLRGIHVSHGTSEARTVGGGRTSRDPAVPHDAPPSSEPSGESSLLAHAQAAMAEVLTRAEVGDASPEVVRARGVLERKRADDALPLLPELAARIATCDALALGRIPDVPRLATMTAVADALRIADAAREVPALARFAMRDGALLRARFASGPEGPRPRSMPYVRREESSDGHAVWVLKGFGQGAPVRVIERGARR